MSFQNCKIIGAGVNADEYHGQTAERGSKEFVMSPSSLKLFNECPARWKAGYAPPDSDAKDWGNLLDTLLLTPKQFDSKFAVKPLTYKSSGAKKSGPIEDKPFNANSTLCKEWIAAQNGKTIISTKDLIEAVAALKRLRADETIAAFLDASDCQVHVKGEWRDKATGLVIPVQCLIDCVPRKDSEFQKSLGDLKSTRNAGLRPFARWCFTAGYHVQAAFDLALYCAATGEDRSDWIFLVQENYAPYETGRRLLSQDFLQIGRQTYEAALKRYARCVQSGVWQGYDQPEEFSLVAPEPWMEFEALSEKLEADQTEAAEIGDDLLATA